MRHAIALAACLALAACASPASRTTSGPLAVKLIAFNDFHGNLEAPQASIKAPEGGLDDRSGPEVSVPAGGVARFASLIAQLRTQNPNHVVTSSGDMIGASPLVSALFLDEPTIEAMNRIGVDFNGVGNHEFDRGVAELMRKQTGGCERHTVAVEPCGAGHRFEGARFQYLAANVIDRATDKPIFPPYGIKTFEGVRIGFIGLTLKATEQLVDPAGVASVTFEDEAQTINRNAAALRAQGVNAIVVLIHEGGESKGRLNDTACPGLSGDILPILDRLDPGIDVVASAHTHQAYVCTVRGILLTSAASYGRLVTDIDLELDRSTGRVVRKAAVNRIVASTAYGTVPTQPAYPPVEVDPAMAAHVASYAERVGPIASRRVGSADGPIPRLPDRAGQSPLGDIFADSYLVATRDVGAQIAFLNPGSVRAAVQPGPDGTVSYGSLYRAQPFGNNLVTMTLTGRQVRSLLEQQWLPSRENEQMLQVSRGFSYAYDERLPMGSRVLLGSMTIDGVPIVDDRTYRVTVNSFMASGGDGFTVLREGRNMVLGVIDIDAAVAYFGANAPMSLPQSGRVRRVD